MIVLWDHVMSMKNLNCSSLSWSLEDLFQILQTIVQDRRGEIGKRRKEGKKKRERRERREEGRRKEGEREKGEGKREREEKCLA